MDFVVRPRLGFEPNADVFVDEESGNTIYISETGSIAVLPRK